MIEVILSLPSGAVKESRSRLRSDYAARPMALALTLGTLLAIAGLLVTSIQGFAVASGLHVLTPLAKALVTRHVGYAIPSVLFSLFSQSMVIFFFIGTGRLVKDDTARYSEAERRLSRG